MIFFLNTSQHEVAAILPIKYGTNLSVENDNPTVTSLVAEATNEHPVSTRLLLEEGADLLG